MYRVHRTRGIRRFIRTRVMNLPARKYITAGSSSCGWMMSEARRHRNNGPVSCAVPGIWQYLTA